jgi:hypothetical protein
MVILKDKFIFIYIYAVAPEKANNGPSRHEA